MPALAGINLKAAHMAEALGRGAALDFVEVHAENHMVDGGPMLGLLARVRERWPLSVHGVGLSIGGAEPLDLAHLDRLAALLARFEPRWFSEHLAWSSHDGECYGDLLPLPYHAASLHSVCAHIDQTQQHLRRPMLLENPSTYVEFASSTMDEPTFLAEVVRRTGCGLLLDINNLYVSCVNHGRNPDRALDTLLEVLPAGTVGEIHLAGFAEDHDAAGDRLLIDHHGAAVDAAVWRLYTRALDTLGPIPTLLERDNDLPSLAVLEAEVHLARAMMQRVAAPGRAGGDGSAQDGLR